MNVCMKRRIGPMSLDNSPVTCAGQRHHTLRGRVTAREVAISVFSLITQPRRLCNRRCLSVCLLATLRKNFRTDLHEVFREGWQWAKEQMIKLWCRSGSPSGYRDCFPDSSLLGDMESGYQPTALHDAAVQSMH